MSHPPRAAGTVDKSGSGPALPAPIRRIFYLSSEGTQQVPAPSQPPAAHAHPLQPHDSKKVHQS